MTAPAKSFLRACACALALALLAACGEPDRFDDEMFVRDIPDHVAQPEAAPLLSEIRPVPDLHADRRALAVICNARGVDEPLVCGCIANAGADEFSGRHLAYFAAHVIGDRAELARMQSSHTEQEQASLSSSFAAIALRCGSRSLETTL